MNNSNIKAGDIVKVVNWGSAYPTYVSWFLTRVDELKPEWLVRYVFDVGNYKNYPEKNLDNRRWEVLFVDGAHALITEKGPFSWPPVYLIGVDGLAPMTREMTLSEIEAKLGYPVKIIKEK